MCESESGYCSQFKIYIGKDKIGDMPASESVVMELSKHVLGKGYTIYLDNWYSSPNLFLNMLKNERTPSEPYEKIEETCQRNFRNQN